MEIIKTAKLIQSKIDSVQRRGKTLDNDIHVLGVSVLSHASEHGDTTLADRLVQALPKGSRKLALVEWMLAFGQVEKLDSKNVEDAQAIKAGRIFKLNKERTLDLKSAAETSWVEFRQEAKISTAWDVQQAVKGLLTKYQNANAKGMTIEGRGAALADAQALVELLSAK